MEAEDQVQPEPTPEPTPEPEPEPFTPPTMQVPCGNCKSVFEFPETDESGAYIENFKFQCTNCGADNEWNRA